MELVFKGPDLSYVDAWFVVSRLLGPEGEGIRREIVLNLGSVERFDAPWTPILAVFVWLAQRTPNRCRIDGLHGQPAMIAALHRICLIPARMIRSLEDDPKPTGYCSSALGCLTT